MILSGEKNILKQELIDSLKNEPEIRRIVIFGSFATSPRPHDMDIAVFQDSNDTYLQLAMKYRRKTRLLAQKITLDIIPLKSGVDSGYFMDEIQTGEVVYERRN